MRALDPIVIVVSNPEADEPRYHFRPASRWPGRSVGVAVTVLVHVLLTAPLVLGVAAHKSRPNTQDGPGSVAWASKGEQSESMTLLDLSAMTSNSADDVLKPDINSEGIQPDEFKLELVSFEPRPPQELKIDAADIAEETNQAAGDPTGNAALFGRYMGQVGARIERAWMRPRVAVEGERFDCSVRVVQDRQGNVLSVFLQNCGTNETWRRSLTSAILRASPLSAPPEPWLFTETLSLNFAAEQYKEGQTPEYEYEPVITRVAANYRAQKALSSADEVATSESVLGEGTGDVELTISGDKVTWSKKKESASTKQ